ncbi:16S rRNA (uracil(1498)-N(3))-methyltransferase [Thiomicrorhabdus sp. 6S3-12]|uniref:16S rRNA (uracil(1498)-N(3))-methyltransferase n=1 Tax=Thiomicrorhabdus sp. 6S3-12 TaxID=2819681 RepID=UPI001AAD9F95|nr:16S rRNA (uracil(1498)-N(3))-methyltransferase [Thiomicrorhabdus sp. 6S3-12]MBO1923885.1 16S rRNA (uracil(1498)-N(3))-methyltransferase [Thiomicrorhabdus sp. 6S3-12]
MRIPRLYLPADFAQGATLSLSREQAHYALTVLRLKDGHPLELFDGQGNIARAKLEVIGRREANVILEEIHCAHNESPLNSVLLQGISRGDRMDYSIQKAVELGVTAILPLFTERCEVKLKGDKLEKRRSQWQSIAINACEQSGRAFVPEILPITSLKDFFAEASELQGIVCDPYAEQTLKQLAAPTPDTPLHILVGPEGGLSDEEVALAVQNGFAATRLGPRVLRTETAGPAMLAIAQSLWGDI